MKSEESLLTQIPRINFSSKFKVQNLFSILTKTEKRNINKRKKYERTDRNKDGAEPEGGFCR